MVAVPAATPVTTPVLGFTVAMAGVLLLQVPPAAVDVNVVLDPTQIACVPLRMPAVGAAVTVTVRVAVALAHPPVPFTV